MASVDIKDTYFTIPIHLVHQFLLRFLWHDTYQFTAMPKGYADVIRAFTKILKPPFALWRKLRQLSMMYVDYTYIEDESFLECMYNLENTVALLQALGSIHTSRQIATYTNSKNEKLKFNQSEICWSSG